MFPSTRSGNADAGCSRPSSRRGSQRSARAHDVSPAEIKILLDPRVDDRSDVIRFHSRKRQAVIGRKTSDAADAPLASRRSASSLHSSRAAEYPAAARQSRYQKRMSTCNLDCVCRRLAHSSGRDSSSDRTSAECRGLAFPAVPATAGRCGAARPAIHSRVSGLNRRCEYSPRSNIYISI